MESEWRLNVERFHGGGYQVWQPPIGITVIRQADLAAELDPHITVSGTTYTHLVRLLVFGDTQFFFFARLLANTLWFGDFGISDTTRHYPYGFSVKPDHV